MVLEENWSEKGKCVVTLDHMPLLSEVIFTEFFFPGSWFLFCWKLYVAHHSFLPEHATGCGPSSPALRAPVTTECARTPVGCILVCEHHRETGTKQEQQQISSWQQKVYFPVALTALSWLL